jgi:hypothetical protein
MRLLAITSALLALAGAAPATAPAAVTTPIPAAPFSGPVVAGGEAVWAGARPDQGFNLLAAPPGGPYRTVQRFASYVEPGGHDVSLVPQLSSAGARIGLAIDAEPIPFSRYESDFEPAAADVLTGPPSGPLAPELQCRPGLPAGVSAAVTEHGVVAPGPDCDAARASGIALRSDGADVRPLTPSGSRVRAAGPFVGWIGRDRDVVVYDTRTAAVAYRIVTPSGSGIADWDLQADGKVALALALSPNTDSGATLAWYSAEDPTAHPLGLPAASAWDLHIAGDRIAYLRSHQGTGGYGFYFGDLGVTDLAGHARRISNRAIGIGQSHPSLAFDGSNVTWAAPACFGALLHSQSVDEPPVIGPRPHCRLGFRKRPRMLGKDSIRVPVRCSGFVLPGCGDSEVKLRAVNRHVTLGSDVTRFCDNTADVLLTRRGSALVRRLRKLRVRATVTTIDTGGAREVRSASFTLRTRDRIVDASSCEDEY